MRRLRPVTPDLRWLSGSGDCDATEAHNRRS
jgi:hypothetical protein